VGASAAVAACVVGAVSTEIAAGVVMALLLGVAWAFMHSSFQTWATQVVPAARAAAVSLFAGFLFVGSALGALLTGGLAEAGRYQTVFLLAAVVAVPLGILGTVGRARWAEHEDRV
jgi:MFS family permease